MKSALLLIDIQLDYFSEGRMPLYQAEQAGHKAGQLLEAFRQKSCPVIHIRHEAIRADATFFIKGTPGSAFYKAVSPQAGEITITKHAPNSFQDTALFDVLTTQKITHLVIAGMMTQMCVDATVRAAKDFGFDCVLIHDACATKALEWKGVKIEATTVQATLMASLSYYYAKVKATSDYLADI